MNSKTMIMLSAMYENGGNTTHRFLDGHPELFVYPFESQLGNDRSPDYLTSLFPFKYRWPDFPVGMRPDDLYEVFFDEEMKVRLRVPHVSKFRDAKMELPEKERKRMFVAALENRKPTRGEIIAAFFEATFDAWKDYPRSGREHAYVGYSPIIGVDSEKIITDFPDGHVIHVVRNPYSAFADTSKRPFPLSLHRYSLTWSTVQLYAATFAARHPDKVHIVRFEDLVANPRATMTKLAGDIGIEFSETMLYASWGGAKLEQVYPWGTIRTPTTEANLATLRELTPAQRSEIRSLTLPMLKEFGYLDL
jgi:hypothetical protein